MGRIAGARGWRLTAALMALFIGCGAPRQLGKGAAEGLAATATKAPSNRPAGPGRPPVIQQAGGGVATGMVEGLARPESQQQLGQIASTVTRSALHAAAGLPVMPAGSAAIGGGPSPTGQTPVYLLGAQFARGFAWGMSRTISSGAGAASLGEFGQQGGFAPARGAGMGLGGGPATTEPANAGLPSGAGSGAPSGSMLLGQQLASGFVLGIGRGLTARPGPNGGEAAWQSVSAFVDERASSVARTAARDAVTELTGCELQGDRASCVDSRVRSLGQAAGAGITQGALRVLLVPAILAAFVAGVVLTALLGWVLRRRGPAAS